MGVVCLAGCGGGGGSSSANAPEPPVQDPGVAVDIPDANLRRVLERALRKSAGSVITDVELRRLRTVRGEREGIVDLTGLGAATSLQNLHLANNEIETVAPLEDISTLEHLDLTHNKVADVSILEDSSSLRILSLDRNPVNPASVGLLTSLTWLSLLSVDMKDIAPLSSLKNLETLYLNYNAVSDLTPIAGLVELRFLFLAGTEINSLSQLTWLENLETLNISHTDVKDLTPIAGLRRLSDLWIGFTRVPDLTQLTNLNSLRVLDISHLDVDLAPLVGLPNLTTVRQLSILDHEPPPQTDISPVAGMQNLVWLTASPRDGDLTPLTRLATLKRVEFSHPGTDYTNLAALRGLGELFHLRLSHGSIRDISIVERLSKLETLNLDGNQVNDLSALQELASLAELSLQNNHISDVTPLVDNPSIDSGTKVLLRGNPLSADALLEQIPQLEARGVSVQYDRDDFLDSTLQELHNGAVSMRVDVDLSTIRWELDLRAYTQEFFKYFEDEFDLLIFISALHSPGDHDDLPYAGVYHSVSNEIEGLGLGKTESNFDNVTRLKGIIHLPWVHALLNGPALHEVMHMWANFGLETARWAHWGFSSTHGQLGGFNLEHLVDHGDGLWSAGHFGSFANGGNSVPYSPIELYLGGFIDAAEVPDVWVAPQGHWSNQRTEEGYLMFETQEHSMLTIEEFIAENGPRNPDHTLAQREFRGAVIVMEDNLHRVNDWERLLQEVSWFSSPKPDETYLYNFHEATGGRARLTLEGLPEFVREEPLTLVPRLHLTAVCPAGPKEEISDHFDVDHHSHLFAHRAVRQLDAN